ncbi:ATP-grasp domain-containing protein [Candidatus Uhrbacteria bacterium]|nr:ATP-grasp domain-containing protein [Candidatus Uhrbacteria bacterium]
MGCESHSKCNIPADSLVLGILGGGSLGSLIVQAAHAIGVKTAILDPSSRAPALRICDFPFTGALNDEHSIRALIAASTHLTYVSDTCDVGILRKYAAVIPIHPSPETFSITQDSLFLQQFLTSLQIPVVPAAAKRKSAAHHRKYILPLGRAHDGRLFYFPTTEIAMKGKNVDIISVRAQLSTGDARKIKSISRRIAESLRYVGVISIEFVATEKKDIFVLSIIPHVHESGAHTIKSCTISQFEEHVRLVCSLPPKRPRLKPMFADSRRIGNTMSENKNHSI